MVRAILDVRVWRAAAVSLALAAVAFLGFGTSARAAGTPDISAAVSSSSNLYGQPIEVRMSATNPDTEYGYNLSFRVVLPPGVKYASGGGVTPTQIADRPTTGETTLIFSNVSDLSPSSTREVAFEVEYSDTLYEVGDSFPVAAQAFVNEDPRFIPKFDADGEPEGPSETSFTGNSDEVIGTQTLKALDVNITEPSAEGEILRGVHDHQTVYTLTVTNNGVNPTTETKLDAYIPAGLEFLGCGGLGMDNTTDAPTNAGSPQEYAGSGAIENSVLGGCVEPESVETEEVDPDGAGPLPKGVYTHVVWPVGALGDGETKTFPFRAAVPIRANTDVFTGTRPTALSGNQAANLDNNSGAEVVDETALRTYVTASGVYQGKEPTPAADAEELLRTAEDWVVRKSGPGTLAQGAISKWTLTFETSEYKFVNDATITDTLPDGLCPLGSKNFTSKNDGPDSECDPVVGEEPTAEYASATENANGSWTLTWDKTSFPALAHTGVNDKLTLEFPTRTRTHYQESEVPQSPILTNDSVVNKVETSASGFARCTVGLPDCSDSEESDPRIDHDGVDGATIFDASAAEQVAGGAVIDKEVAATGANCLAATYTEEVPHYRPGDRICWKIRVEFPSTLDTSPQAIADYLPPGTEYVPGSEAKALDDNVIAEVDDSNAEDGLLTWTITGGTVPAGETHVLERVFATTVAPTGAVVNGDLKGNLLKFASKNTSGETIPQRDEANFVLDAPVLDLVKGVAKVVRGGKTIVGPNGEDVDGGTVVADDTVEYRIDVTNKGDAPGWNVQLRSVLEDGITCADVLIVSHTGGCVGANHVEWGESSTLASGATETYIYVVKIPSWVEPGTRFNDHAGIVSYQSSTNSEPVPGFFTYYPAENIGGAGPTPNAPAADDTSWVETPSLQFTKTRTTGVKEDGNSAETQATIGERIDYKVTLVVPEGTTIYGAEFTDIAGPRHSEILESSVTLNGSPWLGMESTGIDPVGVEYSVTFPSVYSNAAGSGDDVFEFKLATRVADDPANRRTSPHETLTNAAHLTWKTQAGTAHKESASVNTAIVEPNVAVAKTNDDLDEKVSAGQVVNYTVTASNPAGTRISTAHDLVLVDKLPSGLAPVLPIGDEGEWDAGERTITWKITSLKPGEQVKRIYAAEVVEPAIAGEVFVNQAKLTATSMAGAIEGERRPDSEITTGYTAEALDELRLGDATLKKAASPTEATIGQEVTYTTEVFFPGNVEYFDAMVIDHLPDGLVFDKTVGVICDGGPCTPSVLSMPVESHASGESTIAWFLDDFLSEPGGRTYEITYTAHVGSEYVPPAPVSDGQILTNTAEAAYDSEDEMSEPPAKIPSAGEFTGGQSNVGKAEVDVIEPEVAIEKAVSGDADEDGVRSTEPGDSYTYKLTVRNTGSAPAYDVQVTDSWDPTQLQSVNVLTKSGATDEDGSDGDLEWLLPGPIAPSGTVVLEYEADLAPSASLSDGETVVNTAGVPLFWALSEEVRGENPTWDYRKYTEVPDDTVTLDVHLPQLQVAKTPDAAETPDSIAEVGEAFTWRVAVKNLSSVATAYSVDLHDVLPANWDYVTGTASFAPGGTIDPSEELSAPTGDTLIWEDLTDLGPGEEVVLTFQAKPTVAAATDPGSGGSSPNINAAQAEAVDASGAGASAEGPYEADDKGEAVLTLPELAIEKTPDGTAVDAGEDTSYTVKVSNEGDVPAREVVVVDVLGAGQAYAAGEAKATPATGFSEASVDVDAGTGKTTIEWHLAEVPANASVTITLPVATDPDLADGTTLLNDASVSSREIPDPETDGGSHEAKVDSDVGIVKQAQADPVDAGEEMDFTFTVTNHGPSDATGVTVEDVLPANLEFVSAESPCAHVTGTVTCAIGDLAVGQSVELTLTVKVDPDETVEVSNTAKVDSTTPDSNSGNDESTAKKTVGVEANVQVEKEGPAAPVLQGTSFDYTIRVDNAGVSGAADVTLTDELPEGVEFETVETDVGSCSEAGGTVECSFGTLAPGTGAVVTIKVLAVDAGTATNVAKVATTSTETTTTDNEDEVGTEIPPAADLGVTKTAPATVPAGAELTYLLEVVNNGPSPANGVTLTDTLPKGVVFVSADPACGNVADVVTCAVGTLAVSESHSYEVTVEVPFALGGSMLTNSVVVGGNEGDLVTENDSDQATTTVDPAADLTIAKTAGGATAGGTASWTIAVQNKGPSAAQAIVKDALPAGTSFRSATPSQGSCGASGAELTCDLGVLPVGGSAQISVLANVAANMAHQELRNHAAVEGPVPDPDPTNNTAEAVNQVAEPLRSASAGPDLELIKTASTQRPQLGQPFSYKLLVRNVGGSDATKVRVVDTMSKAVELQDASASKGSCSGEGSKVTCGLGTIPASTQASVKVVVVPIAPGDLRNTASVSAAGGADVEADDNLDVAGVRVLAPRARWSLAKRASRRVVRGGDAVRFAISVRMRGRAAANARVCDPLPPGLVFVKAPGARFTGGKACWRLPYLAPNARRTVYVVARAERGYGVRRVRNVAEAMAANADRRLAGARVLVRPAFGGEGGGVTG